MKYRRNLFKLNKVSGRLQESFAKNADRLWAMGVRRLIGLGIIICGFCVVAYAVIIPVYNDYLNNKRVENVRNAISGILRADAENTDPDNYMNSGMTQEEYESLSVSDKEKIDAQIRKERLAMATVADQNIIGIIEIEKLNIMYAVVEGTKGMNIKASIGHIETSSAIGADGTCILAGHRGGMYGEMFDHIDKLENGDMISVTDLTGTEYTYEVYEQKVIKPKDWSIQDWIDGQITLVLLTCESGGSTRLCVMCRMVDVETAEDGSKVIDVLKPTTTQTPTAVPTAEPTPVPREKRFHVKIVNEFGDTVYDHDTDQDGNWGYQFIDGTYEITFTYSNGDEEVEQRIVGSGVASRVSKIVITDMNERIVYIGETDAEGNYDIALEDGDYVMTFTDVFGKQTTQNIHVGL